MSNNYYREKAWIKKKLSYGVSYNDLYNSVGAFSDKKKEKVMSRKNLTSKEYDERKKFLGNVYYLMSNGYLKD